MVNSLKKLRKKQKPPKGLMEYRLLMKKLISFSKKRVVLAKQGREMTVSANL
jgi:hypothetical protein